MIRCSLSFLLLLLTTLAVAQNVAINNIIATDYQTTEDDVLEIEFGDILPNLPFIIAWIDQDNKQYALQFVTTDDKLIVPLNGQKGWNGKIGLIGLSINNVSATIRPSQFGDYLRDFMVAHPMTPGSVNFTWSFLFLGYPFTWITLGIMGVFWLLLSLKMSKVRITFLLSFLIAWSIFDLRNAKNRWDIMTYLEGQEYQIDIFKDLDSLLQKARPIIGEESWTKEPLSGVLNSYCTYQLADLPYKPPRDGLAKEADFIITTTPRNRKVELQEGRYFLVRANKN